MDLFGMFEFAAIIGSIIIIPLAYALLKRDRPERREKPKPQPPQEPTYWKEMALYQYGEELLERYRKKREDEK
ncbi:MAG: hypothetical protein NTV61_07175 [Candidatus Bathyarchaeota archaeon]|nr:hypothetical protein [Candidatus Bathyarchaeota archaeon]